MGLIIGSCGPGVGMGAKGCGVLVAVGIGNIGADEVELEAALLVLPADEEVPPEELEAEELVPVELL